MHMQFPTCLLNNNIFGLLIHSTIPSTCCMTSCWLCLRQTSSWHIHQVVDGVHFCIDSTLYLTPRWLFSKIVSVVCCACFILCGNIFFTSVHFPSVIFMTKLLNTLVLNEVMSSQHIFVIFRNVNIVNIHKNDTPKKMNKRSRNTNKTED